MIQPDQKTTTAERQRIAPVPATGYQQKSVPAGVRTRPMQVPGRASGSSGLPMSARERRLSRFLLFLEDLVKVPLFHCQHCGECVLSSTAFICSQNCPKRLRNGPCGGTRDDGTCEVYPDRKCVWYRIYFR